MERDPPEEALIRLEDQEQFYRYVHHKSLPLNPLIQNKNPHHKGLDWYKIIDRGLVDNLGKYRKYDGGSIRDLLRVMRNKVSDISF
jgi:serine/threonine-protein kinase/endoribonuclease IRE1